MEPERHPTPPHLMIMMMMIMQRMIMMMCRRRAADLLETTTHSLSFSLMMSSSPRLGLAGEGEGVPAAMSPRPPSPSLLLGWQQLAHSPPHAGPHTATPSTLMSAQDGVAYKRRQAAQADGRESSGNRMANPIELFLKIRKL